MYRGVRTLTTSARVCMPRQKSVQSAETIRKRTPRSKRPFDIDTMPEFQFNDQTTIGHELFRSIRDVRGMLRKIEYEIPKLSAFSKPFTPPTSSQILRFQHQVYPSEPNHPSQSKSVLSVRMHNLQLTPGQRHKFLLLVGPRYDPHTDSCTFSCERFPHLAQNRRYLGDLIERLVAEAKDSKDTFSDIPLDTRHVRPRQKLEFPKEWIRKD